MVCLALWAVRAAQSVRNIDLKQNDLAHTLKLEPTGLWAYYEVAAVLLLKLAVFCFHFILLGVCLLVGKLKKNKF